MATRRLLWVSGVLTAIDLAFPQLWGVGLFLGIVPGFILAVAPTVFIYTATFAIVRRYLPITRTAALNFIAAFTTLGLGILVPLPMAAVGWLAFHRAITGDVAPHDRVVIGGDVLLNNEERRPEYIADKREVVCDALCAALLDTPGVRTVTIAHADGPTSYRLVPKAEAGSKARVPKSPQQILQYLPESPAASAGRDFQTEVTARKAREDAVTAHWGLRLANDVALSIVPSPANHDLTITMTSTGPSGFHRVAVRQVEVRDRDGNVLLRRQRVTALRMFVPLLVIPYDTFGGSDAGWQLAHMDLESGARLSGKNSITALFDETTLARPPEPGAAVASTVATIRDRLAAALTQPGTPADLSLADPWIATINWRSIDDDDLELLGKLIADTRVTDLPRIDEGAINPMRPELRGVIVARLINPATLPQLRKRLDNLVQYMPPGTFAVPTPDELTLLHNPLLRMNAPSVVLHLADQGNAGVPELVRILQEDVRVEPKTMREGVLAAIRRAFIRLGPEAASALPVVIELYDQGGALLGYTANEKEEWRVAMVLMGRPIEDVPFEPGLTAEKVTQRRTDLMRLVAWARNHPDWHH